MATYEITIVSKFEINVDDSWETEENAMSQVQYKNICESTENMILNIRKKG